VLLDQGTNKQPSEPKHTNTHSGNLHGLMPVLHQSDRWPAPVRPVTPVRLVDSAGQASDYSSRITNVPGSLSDFSRPWNNNTPKTQCARKENSTQNLTKQLQTDQKKTSSTKTQKHMSQAVHSRQVPQLAHTGQTGQEHRSDQCNLGSSG
jgi:glutaredoxin